MPQGLQSRVVAWYHEYLQHPGEKCTEETIRQWFYWPGLPSDVHTFYKTCKLCQLSRKQRRNYGRLTGKTAESKPWEQVHIDLVGCFTVRLPNSKKQI